MSGSNEGTNFLTLTAPEAAGTVIPVTFWAEEQMTKPFLVNIDFLSANKNISPDALLYQPICLTVSRREGPQRYFNGMVRKLRLGTSETRDRYHYSVEVVPRLWFMSQTQDCRIFEQQTTKQIIEKLFTEAGITLPQYNLSQEPATRPYTTQMNETDLDFITRLIQEEGWYYFFEHSTSAHTMLIANQNTAFQALALPSVTLTPQSSAGTADYARLGNWKPASETSYGQTVLKDYDLLTPANPPEATQDTTSKAAGASSRDAFHWPALTTDVNLIDQRTRIWIESAEANAALINAAGCHNGFCPGYKFTLESNPITGVANEEYVIGLVVHRGTGGVPWSGSSGETYSNVFSCFPASQIWRELLTMPHPRMHGIYSAVVIGPQGQEIFTDEYARVKVMFPWDRRKDSTPDGSVWLRVIQPWTGANWGTQFIPRVGTEVAVAFMDGDVDRPVVVGGMSNASNIPAFTVPGQKTLSGIETRSTPMPTDAQGNPTGKIGYHLLRFDDAAGNEQLLLRSQARMDVTAKSSLFETVGPGDRHMTVLSGLNEETNTTVKGNALFTIGAPNFGTPPYGNFDLHIGGSRFEQVDGTDYGYQLTVKKDMQTSVEGDCSAVIKGNFSLNAQNIVLEASQKLTLKVGSSTVVMNAGGVYIDGAMVYKQCSGQADSAADLNMQTIMDAQQADPGEPGRSRLGGGASGGSGGGGGSAGRGSQTVPAQHAPACTTDDDGMVSSDMSQWAAGDSGGGFGDSGGGL